MLTCETCGAERVTASVLPLYETDLGGITVRLVHSVMHERCEACGDETFEIPDLEGLARSVAMVRALLPVRLSGPEVRFMRKALDMTGREFAEAMELTPETVSRWETGDRGIGGYSEKLLRHNICALLHKQALGITYDPEVIARMRILNTPPDYRLQPITVRRVMVKDCSRCEEGWDYLKVA